MRDLDFVPAQRAVPAGTAPFAPRPDAVGDVRAFTPRADVATGGEARPIALARFDAAPTTDPAAHAAGWAAGYAAGARKAAQDAAAEAEARRAAHEQAERTRAAEHAAALAALEQAAADLRARRAPVLAEAAATLQSAALELAVTLLGAELSDASAAARAALQRVLRVEGLPDDVTVRLHPRDLAALELPEDAAVRVVADPTLAPGDAVAEHDAGHVDARLTAAVERVRAALEAS